MNERRRSSIAIVGGSGFVGSSLAEHMSSQFDVTVLDRVQRKEFRGNFKLCDIREPQTLTELLQGFDLVVNCAIVQIPEINTNKRLGHDVNLLGVQNLCAAIESVGSIKGLLHASSWHIFGERDLRGVLDEEFGLHPDKIDERARFYALCKIAQESIIRINSEISSKQYGIVRLGTALGERMPAQTAANLFIENSFRREPITPFRHTQHRPMLYVDIQDVCRLFQSMATSILNGKSSAQSADMVNLFSPHPVTIIELAKIVQHKFIRLTGGAITPKIQVIDKGLASLYDKRKKRLFKIDISKARKMLGPGDLSTPQDSIERIIRKRIDLRSQPESST
jgi:nucleoside-diphosphate-sugar epimerase